MFSPLNFSVFQSLLQGLSTTYVFTAIFIILVFIYRYKRRHFYKCASKLPGPPQWPIIGAANLINCGSKAAIKQTHDYHFYFRSLGLRLAQAFFGDKFCLFCLDAAPVNFMLTKFLRKSSFYKSTYNLFRNGVLGFSEIEYWKSNRKAISPSFHHSVIKSYIHIFFEESNILVSKMRPLADCKESFYPGTLISLATFDMVIRSTLGVDPKAQYEDNHPVVKAMNDILESIQMRLFHPFLMHDFISSLLGHKRKEQQYEKVIRDYMRAILRHMDRDKNSTAISFAEHMMESNINEEDLITHIINIIFAGTDTTKTTNFAVLLMLALHQDIQEKAYEEVISVMGTDPTQQPSYEDLLNMTYLEMIIKECLRLFPPVPLVSRQVITDNEKFEDLELPNGTCIVFDIYYLHRDATYYENPNGFNPDRFLPEEIKKRPVGSFVPFLLGPRDCIGRKYAMLQMKTLVSTVLRNYKIVTSESCRTMEDVNLEMIGTSRFPDNCQIQLQYRDALF